MNIPTEQLEQFVQALKGENLRLTTQRRAILENVLGSDEHRDIDDIYLSLKSGGSPVSRATIYRTLDILEQDGFVHKMDIGDGRFRYGNMRTGGPAGSPPVHHDHIICEGCGKIIEFVDLRIERLQEQIATSHGFELLRHTHQLHGLCSDCREQ